MRQLKILYLRLKKLFYLNDNPKKVIDDFLLLMNFKIINITSREVKIIGCHPELADIIVIVPKGDIENGIIKATRTALYKLEYQRRMYV